MMAVVEVEMLRCWMSTMSSRSGSVKKASVRVVGKEDGGFEKMLAFCAWVVVEISTQPKMPY